MAMGDPYSPIKTKVELSEMGINPDQDYYVSFFNGQKLDTRPIKITSIYKVYSQTYGTKYMRTEVNWEYHFETEKKITKKILDPSFWKRLFTKPKIVNEKITEKWKISYNRDWERIGFYLIGKDPHEAKLRLIMTMLETPFQPNDKMRIIEKEFDFYKTHHPDLILKAMNYEIEYLYLEPEDHSSRFLNIEGDLRNGQKF